MEISISLQDVIYQAADKDFNFFEAQVRELDAERNQSIITTLNSTYNEKKICRDFPLL